MCTSSFRRFSHLQSQTDEIINYREQSVEKYVQPLTGGKGFDIVLPPSGGGTWTRNKGQVIKILAFASHDLTPAFVRSLTLHIENISLSLLTGVGREKRGEILRSVQKIRIKLSSFGQLGVQTLL